LERKQLPGTDLVISSICYGTGSFGADVVGADVDALLNLYRDAGGNFLDTAHCYAFWLTPGGAGCSERALADYVRRNGKGDWVIGTKGGHPGAGGYRKVEQWLTASRIEADIDDSLGRLGVDTIDFYWLHRDETRRPVAEIMETLNREVKRGRIRWLGASNWRTDRIAEANAYAAAHGLRGFAASQPEWNLARKNTANPDPRTDDGTATQSLEESDQEWHRRSRLPVIPYTSTAAGYFASGGERAKDAYDNPVTRTRLARARELARELNATPGQIALAWLLHQPFPVIPILGSHHREHLKEDLGAAALRLSPDQMARLTA